MLTESENSACTVIDVFCEFIEIAIHNILYVRKLYPEAIFEPKRKYGVVVYHSIHPGVNEYISNCVNAISFHLKRNQLRSIFLCFTDSDKIVEKYHFEIVNIDSCLESDPFLVKLEQYLNNFCLKLHSSVDCLKNLPNNCTFIIQLQVTQYANLEYSQDALHEDFLWIDSVGNENNSAFVIVPLHSVETNFLKFQTHIEQLC